MRNTDLVQKKKVTTLRQILIKEMLKLQKLRVDKPGWWTDPSASNWARRAFGDNLDSIPAEGVESDPEFCRVCGHKFELDEKFISLTFSFCDEYGCGIDMCAKCLSDMREVCWNTDC